MIKFRHEQRGLDTQDLFCPSATVPLPAGHGLLVWSRKGRGPGEAVLGMWGGPEGVGASQLSGPAAVLDLEEGKTLHQLLLT